jgi:hypothetical protein
MDPEHLSGSSTLLSSGKSLHPRFIVRKEEDGWEGGRQGNRRSKQREGGRKRASGCGREKGSLDPTLPANLCIHDFG